MSRVILRSSSRGILSKRRIFSFGAKDLLPTKRGLSSVPQKASGAQSTKDTIKPDFSWLYLAASSTLLVTAASSVSCEAAVDEKKEKYPTKVQSQQSPTTKAKIPPLYDQDEIISALVNDLMKDPSLNMASLPDPLERYLYHYTIQLTLYFLQELVFRNLHGAQFLSHELQLHRHRNPDHSASRSAIVDKLPSSLNDKSLEQVAKALVENPAIQNDYLPDMLEIELYENCLKCMFRVTALVLNSFSVEVCGHTFQIQMAPLQMDTDKLEQQLLSAANKKPSLTPIDLERLKDWAEQIPSPELSWWHQIWYRPAVVSQLQASLLGMIVGTVDTLLQHTSLQLLADTISVDICAPSSVSEIDDLSSNNKTKAETAGAGFAMASFAAGVGLGVSTMAAFMASKR